MESENKNTQVHEEKGSKKNFWEPHDESEFDLSKDFPEFKDWEMIGFHRQLGSELWNMTLQFLQAGIIIFVVAIITPLTQPYPEINGYSNIAGGLFGLIFTFCELPTNFGIGQFIAENRVRDPEKMMEFLRFFIWWQLMSGLLQVTCLSYFTLQVIVYSNYAYLSWLLLFIVQRQWPYILGIFQACIDGFQHFDKSNLLNFLQGTVVNQLLGIAFPLLGRWYGYLHPEMGEIIAMALFGAIGSYLTNIMFFFISAHYFKMIVKPMGYSIKDAFKFKFGKDVVKRSLSYGIQASIVPIIGGFTGTTILIWYTIRVTAYPSWSALVGIGTTLSGLMGNFGNYHLQAGIAEAYPNGMKHLSEFYISYAMRWRLYFISVFGVSLLAVYPFFVEVIRRISGLEYWVPALIFFVPGIFRRFLDPMIWLPDQVMLGTFHIRQWVIARIIEETIRTTLAYLYLFVWNIQNYGIPGITFLLVFQDVVSFTIKSLGCLVYSHIKICKIKVYWATSLIIPLISTLPIFIISTLWWDYAFFPLLDSIGVIFTALISILMAFFVMFFLIFFPLTALLGGWDDYMFYIFKKAVDISGPSKGLLKMIQWEMEQCIKASRKLRLHGRWSIPHEDADKEIRALIVMKKNGTLVAAPKK